jgi:RNA polymerase sigma-70 factor (ECF subfamily)
LRVWLHRIATNRCLNALGDRGRPQEYQLMVEPPEPTRRCEPIWLEPYPDVLLEGLEDLSLGPEARYEATESIALVFVAALQHLPPRERCTLVLCDVLGFCSTDVASILDTTEASAKSALQRARAILQAHLPAAGQERAQLPQSRRERDVVGQFATAVESGDIDGIVAVLADDALLTMPPEPYEYQGGAAIARFFDDRAGRSGANVKLVPTRANWQPAFGCYLPDAHTAIAHAYGLMVLVVTGEHISAITWFGDRAVMARFGLPRTLPT